MIIKTTCKRFREGDRIAWSRDHVRSGTRIGTVAQHHPGCPVLAWPDDKNHGPERDGGLSEIMLQDVLGFVVPSTGDRP